MKTSVEDLIKQLGDLVWEDFEKTQHGELTIDGTLFRMRVGLHFDKPMQAIMAEDKFLRLRPAHAWESWLLMPLAPDRGADNCLYPHKSGDSISVAWRPTMYKDPQPTTLGAQQTGIVGQYAGYVPLNAQANLQGIGALSGLIGSVHGNTPITTIRNKPTP